MLFRHMCYMVLASNVQSTTSQIAHGISLIYALFTTYLNTNFLLTSDISHVQLCSPYNQEVSRDRQRFGLGLAGLA